MEQILLQTMLKQRENEVIDAEQHDFTKVQWCLTNLLAFCNRVEALVDKEEQQT